MCGLVGAKRANSRGACLKPYKQIGGGWGQPGLALLPYLAMVLAGFIFFLQFGTLLAAVPVCVLSMNISRGKRSQQRSLKGWAIMLMGLAVIGVALSLVVTLLFDENIDDLVFVAPVVTLLLCALPIWRAWQADKLREQFSASRHRSSSYR